MPPRRTPKAGERKSLSDLLQSVPQTLTRHAVTYTASMAAFLEAARQAAEQLKAANGQIWRLDGYKSNKIFLLLPAKDADVYPGDLESEFDIAIQEDSVTVSVFTRSDSLIRLFQQFTERLDQHLHRRAV